jgi:3-keto-disaccharide hydrolase
MIRSLTLLALVSFALPVMAADPQMAPAEPDDMKCLFNGKDLTGWDGDARLWSVKDGVIHGQTTDENKANGNTFLICGEGSLKDFELRLSFRVSTQNNSGIQYRSKHITEKARNEWVVRGYQHEIRNSDKLPSVSGFIYEEGGKRGRMCLVGEKAVWGEDGKKKVTGTLIDEAGFAKLFKVDDWNDVIIIAKGARLQHYMNGRLILDCTDNHPDMTKPEGIVALQLHAGAPMWAEYKNIRLKKN